MIQIVELLEKKDEPIECNHLLQQTNAFIQAQGGKFEWEPLELIAA